MFAAAADIYTMFANIVADVQTNFGSNVHYEHGHLLEVVNTLGGMKKTPAFDPLRYPCIVLLQDFEEKASKDNFYKCDVSLDFLILALSSPSDVSEQRLIKVFTPVLYPIYDLFLDSIVKSGYFFSYSINDFGNSKYDRMYYGKKGLAGNDSNIFGDWVDGIEINHLQLKVLKQYSYDSNIK